MNPPSLSSLNQGKLATSAAQAVLTTRKWERLLAALAIVTIVVAWFAGSVRGEAEVAPHLPVALPQAQRFVRIAPEIYAGYRQDADGQVLVGYVAVGEGSGYGGPMKVAVGLSPDGSIEGIDVVVSRETPSYLEEVLRGRFPAALIGKTPADAFHLGSDLDAVTGATFTTRAIADSVRQASRRVATQELGQVFPEDLPAGIEIGVPEIVLVLLYVVAFVGHRKRFRHIKAARWFTLLTSLIVLGFLYNRPLTLAQVNAFLLGFWPAWQSNLYWYLLLGGILFVFTVDNKNPYCDWFCPFGAAQECIGVVGRAKLWTPKRGRRAFLWLQRGMAWAAIVIALLYRNPGESSYEVFGVLFRFVINTWQFEALTIFLLAALVIKRPWCNFACPLRPVMDLIRLVRGWALEVWHSQAERLRWTRP